jgi:ketosteroid isomerase-like protein
VSDRNTTIVQDAYAAFGRGDIPAVLGALDPNIEWEAVIGADPALVPTAGARRGVDQVAAFFRSLAETLTFEQFEPREFISSGDQVACIGYYKARAVKTGGVISSSWVMVFTVRDGRVLRFREWSDSAQINRAYGG